jgi:hypothetical protein
VKALNNEFATLNIKHMKLAKFVNFTDDLFAHPSLGGHDELCQWGREPYSFPPHTSQTMEDWKAAFFAKHLTNRELLKLPDNIGDYHTSPKNPEEDKYFMEFYNQCYVPVEMEEQTPEKAKDSLIQAEIKEMEKEIIEKPLVWCELCGSKGVRHKKGCVMTKTPQERMIKKTPESEFQGI